MSEGTQTKLANGEPGEPCAASERSGRTCIENAATSPLEHSGHYALGCEQSAETVDAPRLLEVRGRELEDSPCFERTGVVHERFWGPELFADARERRADVLLVRRIARVRSGNRSASRCQFRTEWSDNTRRTGTRKAF